MYCIALSSVAYRCLSDYQPEIDSFISKSLLCISSANVDIQSQISDIPHSAAISNSVIILVFLPLCQ